ncbi:MAG: hypothetical protein KBA46_05880 [Candidatus Omnitrophica bacterium]|nr:hypothetical protein [Candidatus Omnitrophota bacterium]
MKKNLVLAMLLVCCVVPSIFAQEIPDVPSDVSIDANNVLMVQKPDEMRKPFVIKGVSWSPATMAPPSGPNPKDPAGFSVPYGFFFDWYGRDPQGNEVMQYWLKNQLVEYAWDLPIIKDLGANTVRIYHSLGSSVENYNDVAQQLLPVLNECYRNNIMVVMTVAMSRQDLETKKYLSVVNAFKDHPAVLMWTIGNEWNLNRFYNFPWDRDAAAALVEQAAQEIKALDAHHPVCSILGDSFVEVNLGGDCLSPWVIKDIVQACPSVDVWGLNIYRGSDFIDNDGNDVFVQWKNIWQEIGLPSKPFFFSEFGTDSFTTTGFDIDGECVQRAKNVLGSEDEALQAQTLESLWRLVQSHLSGGATQESCLGGLVHEFNDELWKVGNYNVNLGGIIDYANNNSYYEYNPEGFLLFGAAPDNVLNEEHFGLVDAYRQPKQAYARMKALWSAPVDTTAPVGTIRINSNAQYTISKNVTLTLAATDAGSGMGNGAQMRLSNDGQSWSDPEAYVTSKPWVLPAGDWTHVVYVQFKDVAGNWSSTFSDSIILDSSKPIGSVKINNGASTTNSQTVTLSMSITDSGSGMGSGAQMRFSNNNGASWSAAEPFATSKTWQLSAGEGTKTVYSQFKDVAGNWSLSIIDSIVYTTVVVDTQPPVITHTPITRAPVLKSITFNATVIDEGSGVQSATLHWRRQVFWLFWTPWYSLNLAAQQNNTYTATLSQFQTLFGKINYSISAKDKKGLSSATAQYTISRY